MAKQGTGSFLSTFGFLSWINLSICIIGSSIIKWASKHTQNRATGRDLGLDKQGYNVIWVGHQGMLWYMVDNVINIMLSWRRPPAIFLIHCGGNDLCKSKNGKLLFSITGPIAIKLGWNGTWIAPFQNCVWWCQLPTKMAAKLKIEKRGDEILIAHCCFSTSQNELKF
jgi:hypothetical protein